MEGITSFFEVTYFNTLKKKKAVKHNLNVTKKMRKKKGHSEKKPHFLYITLVGTFKQAVRTSYM